MYPKILVYGFQAIAKFRSSPESAVWKARATSAKQGLGLRAFMVAGLGLRVFMVEGLGLGLIIGF